MSDSTIKISFFNQSLTRCFGEATMKKIGDIFDALQLPLPVSENEYLVGYAGLIIFDDIHGVVIRIEEKNRLHVDNNPLILQPLATFDAGNAILDVCAGVHVTNDKEESSFTKEQLRKWARLDYWDDKAANNGRLPVETSIFPKGVPVIIDRLSVNHLSKGAKNIKKILKSVGLDHDPQEIYEPIRKILKRSLIQRLFGKKIEAQSVKNFWSLCSEFKKTGKLICGWHEDHGMDHGKLAKARDRAVNYSNRVALKQEN